MNVVLREELESKMYSTEWRGYPAWESFVSLFIASAHSYGQAELNQAWFFYSRGFEMGDR